MVNRRFFNYCLEKGNKIADDYDIWDNDCSLENIDDNNLAFEYMSVEHNNLGTIYVELNDLARLLVVWCLMSDEEKGRYN
jgi:hypothetical protein